MGWMENKIKKKPIEKWGKVGEKSRGPNIK